MTATTTTAAKKISPRKSANASPPVVAKVAAKPARAVVTKTAPKAAPAIVAKTGTKPARPALAAQTTAGTPHVLPKKLFVLIQGARPVSGPALVSHTHAAFTVLGMLNGAKVKKNIVAAVMGVRAIGYHLGLNNFEAVGPALKISDIGQRVFNLRVTGKTYQPKLTDAYVAMFLRGKTSDEFHIAADNLVQIGL